MTEQLIEFGKAAGALVAIAGLLTLAWKAGRGMLRTVRRLGRLADEVLGDGDERPGWGKRLAAMEKDVAALKRTSAALAAEVTTNGGSSMRDQINRIEEATGAAQPEGKPPG